MSAVTYELRVNFDPRFSGTKAAVKSWLQARGREDIVVGVIDGIATSIVTDDPEQAFLDEDEDLSPLLLFDFNESTLLALEQGLRSRFGDAVRLDIFTLATESWQHAWSAEAADTFVLKTQRFLVCLDEASTGCDGRLPIFLSSGFAFGRGDHATTQACLEMLEDFPSSVLGDCKFLDVGTGTGVLAIAAAKLGFEKVIGTDIDDSILDEALTNAHLNNVQIELFNAEDPATVIGDECFDVVAANILVPVLHQLLPQLERALSPQGRLLLAGFIEKDVPELMAVAQRSNLALHQRRDVRGWVCLCLRKNEGSHCR